MERSVPAPSGEMAEWLKAHAWKACIPQGIQGSNPCLSAIFLALIEERTNSHRAQMEEILAKSPTIEGNLAALRDFCPERVEDQAWSLLLLEFKLFAMRHPESKKRLQSLYAGILSRKDEKRLANIIGAAAKGKDAISRVIAIQSMQPVISALVLEAQLETNPSEKNVVRNVVHRIFDALLKVSPW